MEIADIIEATADGLEDVHGGGIGKRATSSPRGLARTRATIARFLANCPDDITVFELRRALEEQS